MKRIALVGATGSIGRQTLQVARERGYQVVALAAGRDKEQLKQQILDFRPEAAALFDEEAGRALKQELEGCGTQIFWGAEGVCRVAAWESANMTVNAAVGIAGLRPTLAALEAGKTLALANKESLVCAGDIVMPLAKEKGVAILPVDSEHSAIFQSIQGSKTEEIERLILTASGGPFFGKKAEEIADMTAADALKHPTWSMGAKITVDSATMMNKGFEMIEAMHLFGVKSQQIDVVVHRESIVHSLAEFRDGSVLAQLSPPDMCLPIQYAVDYPDRHYAPRKRLDLASLAKMTFFAPDEETFRSIGLCRRAMEQGGTLGAAINGANEVAVAAFLKGEITFGAIYPLVSRAAEETPFVQHPDIETIFETDRLARARARALMKG